MFPPRAAPLGMAEGRRAAFWAVGSQRRYGWRAGLADGMGMASLLRRSLALLRAPANEIAFATRSRLRWSRGPVVLAQEPKQDLFDWLEGAERRDAERVAARLERRYDLVALRARSTRLFYAENLALLECLEALVGGDPLPASSEVLVRAVDVGCGVFQYATGLRAWLGTHGVGTNWDPAPRQVVLRGVEIDGYGIYRDGHSRADHGRAHAALAGPGTDFLVGDFGGLAVPPQDLVTMFYPFLSAYPLLRWGSPISHLRPRRLVKAVARALRPGGWLIIANQTEAEFERLGNLLAGLPLQLVRRASWATNLVPYGERTLGRIGSLWRRAE